MSVSVDIVKSSELVNVQCLSKMTFSESLGSSAYPVSSITVTTYATKRRRLALACKQFLFEFLDQN